MGAGSREDRIKHKRTSDCLKIRGEDEDFNEPQAQQCVFMLPDDSWDQQELSVAR